MATEAIIFHCKPLVLNEDLEYADINDKDGNPTGESQLVGVDPTHTLAFDSFGDNGIIVGWAAAHENDTYNKKLGREMALERIGHVINRLENFPQRAIHNLIEITETELPASVTSETFDYYLQKAVSKLIDLEAHETVTLFFRTTRKRNTVCSMTIPSDAIIAAREAFYAAAINNMKVAAENDTSNYIFAVFTDAEDNLMIAVQNRQSFYDDGLNMSVTDELIETLDPIMAADDAGFEAMSEDEIMLTNDTMNEIEVVRYLMDAGLAYDGNLELEFTSDEADA